MFRKSSRPIGALPRVDFADPLLHGQVGWWLGNEGAGTKIANIAQPGVYNGTLQSGATWTQKPTGTSNAFDGTSTSYIDLGTVALIDKDSPFTLMWTETVATSPPAFAGVCCFMPANSTQRWLMFHDDGVSYGLLAFGLGQAVATHILNSGSGQSLATRAGGAESTYILTSSAGMASNTAADWSLIINGVSGVVTANSNGLSSQTGNVNYLGWDGADSKWKGSMRNFRLWNRVLLGAEKNRLIADPNSGLLRPRSLKGSATVSRTDRMLIAM